MTTESDRIGQTDGGSTLTTRQAKFLPVLLGSANYTEACKKGRGSRDTLYQWLREPEFKTELQRRREELAAQGYALLSQSVRKAIETLVGLLNTWDDRLKRLAANDVARHFLKYKELRELEDRLAAIEERLETQGR